jgi:mannose-6-phosphate isomerase
MTIPDLILLPPNRVWRTYPGGRTLDILDGRSDPSDGHFPEDWVASATRAVNPGRGHAETEGLSTVLCDGRTHLLSELLATYPETLLGPDHVASYGPQTGFLLKLLDSAVRLHLQAHPTARFASERLGSPSGKTEAYLILSIRPEVHEPYIYLGFQRPVGRAEFRRAVLDQDLPSILGSFRKIPVSTGDVFLVPGGLPHAIGEGMLMVEIMEPTDFVVRFEFERAGYVLPEEARFMGRDVDFALDMLDFTAYSANRIREMTFCRPREVASWDDGSEEALIDATRTPAFRLHRVRTAGTVRRTGHAFSAGIVTGGTGTIEAGDVAHEIRRGDRFLVPYQTGEVRYRSGDALEVVLAFPPAGAGETAPAGR